MPKIIAGKRLYEGSDGRFFVPVEDIDFLRCMNCREVKCETVETDNGDLNGVRVARNLDLPCFRTAAQPENGVEQA